mgnify:CR=1 FL=1
MIRALCIPAALLLLAACADGKITPAESALTTCQAFTASLNVATSLNKAKQLSQKQVGLVDKAVAIADPKVGFHCALRLGITVC